MKDNYENKIVIESIVFGAIKLSVIIVLIIKVISDDKYGEEKVINNYQVLSPGSKLSLVE